jgi:hypothetical protein
VIGQVPDAPVLVPAATAAAALRPTRRAHHGFYAWAGTVAFAVVLIGFARSFYLKLVFGTSSLPWLLHLHGVLMTSWFALFFVQTYLVASPRVRAHRRLGVAGAMLAALIPIIGVAVALRATARDARLPHSEGPAPLAFMGFLFAALLVFSILVGAALLLRRRREYHGRLMLLSCLSMIGPGLARIPLDRLPAIAFLKTGGPGGLFGLDLLILYACIAWDTWRFPRLHPAFLAGGLLIVALGLPFIWMLFSTQAWTRIATWLVGHVP